MRTIKYTNCPQCARQIYVHCWNCNPYIAPDPLPISAYEKPQYPYLDTNTSTPQLEVSSKDAVILVYIAGHYLKNPRVGDVLLKTLSENAKIVADKLIKALVA